MCVESPTFALTEQAAKDAVKREREAGKVAATQARREKLRAGLAAAALPSYEELSATYGESLVASDEYLAAFISLRATAPYTLAEAVKRVRTLISKELTLTARAAELARKQAELDSALVAACGLPYAQLDYALRVAVDSRLPRDLVRDADPAHALPPAALQAAAAAVKEATEARESRRAEYAAALGV